MSDLYNGIPTLEGREQVGAVLTIGKKGPRGYPVETDRFHVVSPHENQKGIRPPLGSFSLYNDAKPEKRQLIRANIMHATVDEAFNFHYRAQKLPSSWEPGNPVGGRPCCTGDGHKATRYFGADDDEEDWREIPCPGEQCEFRNMTPPPCGPWGRLYFRPRWTRDELPCPLMKWASTSWNSLASALGMFEYVENVAEQLGLEEWSVFGLPFSMTLSQKKKKKKVFPVVSFSVDCDLISFFQGQRQMIESAGGHLSLPEASGNLSEDEVDSEVVDADYQMVVPGTKDTS